MQRWGFTLENDAVFQYLKLFLENISIWSLIALGLVIWIIRKPERLKAIPRYISSAKLGEFEVQLREVKQKLDETEAHVAELEEENARLNTLYSAFDIHAPVSELEETRQSLKVLAGNLPDTAPIHDGLKPGADPADVYVAAEILRTNRDLTFYDVLVAVIARIAAHPKLEGLRYHTVWTLASALHRMTLAAVKHSDVPKVTKDQLGAARNALTLLRDNPHVQLDCPTNPKQGIRGPAGYALNWVDKGLDKYTDR